MPEIKRFYSMMFYPQWVFTTGGQRQQRQIWGTCAGLILLADRVYDSDQSTQFHGIASDDTDQSTQLQGLASDAGQELERQRVNIPNGEATEGCITPQRVRVVLQIPKIKIKLDRADLTRGEVSAPTPLYTLSFCKPITDMDRIFK